MICQIKYYTFCADSINLVFSYFYKTLVGMLTSWNVIDQQAVMYNHTQCLER